MLCVVRFFFEITYINEKKKYKIGIPPWSWTGTFVSTSTVAAFARALTPHEIVPQVVKTTEKKVYMNVNLAYGFWKDIDFDFLHWFDFRHPLIYIPYLIVLSNVVLNGPPYLLLTWFSKHYVEYKS